MLVNVAKFQGYSFCHFWVIKGKTTGGEGGVKFYSPLPRLGLKYPEVLSFTLILLIWVVWAR